MNYKAFKTKAKRPRIVTRTFIEFLFVLSVAIKLFLEAIFLLVIKLSFLIIKTIKAILKIYLIIGLYITKFINRHKEVRKYFIIVSLVLYFSAFLKLIPRQIEANNIEIDSVENTAILGTVITTSNVSIEENFNNDYFISASSEKKLELIENIISSYGYSQADIETFKRIAIAESCKGFYNGPDCMNPYKTPPVFVKHCLGASGWYVVEIRNGLQAFCNSGDLEGRNEKSFGIFQILETTWEGNQCQGDRFQWENQVRCAVKIQASAGFTQWTTY